MKTENLLIIAALGAAAFLVLAPKRAAAGPTAGIPGGMVSLAGSSASQIWTDAMTSKYRQQLAQQLQGAPDFWI